MRQGFFITLEGGEGGGKSTQAKLLAAALKEKHYDVLLTREPGGSPGAEMIRKLLVEGNTKWDGVTETLLHNAARREHLVNTVWPALETGKIVISDRYSDSTKAYQGAGHNISPIIIENITTASTVHSITHSFDPFQNTQENTYTSEIFSPRHGESLQEFKPDLTFIFDLPVEEGLSRAMARAGNETRYENMDQAFHKRLRQGFLDIAKKEPERCKVIDASRDFDSIHKDVLGITLAALEKRNA